MVTINLKLIFVLIFYVIHFADKNVRCESNDTKKESFDFREVVEENSGYSPFTDQCALRIYGGRPAKISDIPYQVVIRRGTRRGDRWTLLCGGSIITRQYVLTAAHCFERPALKILRFFRVVAGSEKSELYIYTKQAKVDLQRYIASTELWRKITYCYKHAWYNAKYILHDFAVLQMDKPVYYTQNIQPIPMLRDSLGIKPKENELCLVSGYGYMEYHKRSPTLRMVCVPIVSRERCNRIYGRGTVRGYQFCAGDKGKDSCQGDSGGPITYHGYLIGIVSYGGRCGEAPGVYSLVSSYTTGAEVPFIRNHCVTICFHFFGIVLVLGLSLIY